MSQDNFWLLAEIISEGLCTITFVLLIVSGFFFMRSLKKKGIVSNPTWNKICEGNLPDRITRYASKHGVRVLVFDQVEYVDSGSYVPNECTFKFEDQTFYSMCTNGSFVPVSVTHWCELPAKPYSFYDAVKSPSH